MRFGAGGGSRKTGLSSTGINQVPFLIKVRHEPDSEGSGCVFFLRLRLMK
jgi:hypothetical protein